MDSYKTPLAIGRDPVPVVIKGFIGSSGYCAAIALQALAKGMSSEPLHHDKTVLQAPTAAADAVLKRSDPVPHGLRQVKGIEFDDFKERDMTVRDLVAGMATTGFQASAVAEAVRIINDMVRLCEYASCWPGNLMVS